MSEDKGHYLGEDHSSHYNSADAAGVIEQPEKAKKRVKQLNAMRRASHEYLADNDFYELWDYVEKYGVGEHWGNENANSKDQAYPAVQAAWKVTNAIHAKIFNQKLRPVVVPEEASNFPVPEDHPWREAVLNSLEQYRDINGQPVFDPVMNPETGQPEIDPQTGQPAMQPRMESPFQGETDNEIAAELLTAALDFSWDKNDLDVAFEEATRMALWFGTSFFYTGWDDEDYVFGKEQGLATDALHPRDCIFDPANTTLNPEKGRWFGFDVQTTFQEIENMFPEKKEQLREMMSGYLAKSEGSSGRKDKAFGEKNINYTGEGSPNREEEYNSVSGIGRGLQNAILEITWVKDRTLKKGKIPSEEPILDSQGNIIGMKDVEVDGEIPKYRYGWVKCYKVGNLLLDEVEMDDPHGNLPITAIRCYNVPDRFLGMGVMEQCLGLNIAIDRHLKYAIENARRTSQNKFIINEFGIENLQSAMDNSPGGIIRIKADIPDIRNIVYPLQGQELPQSHVQLVNMGRELISDVTGERDILGQEDLPKDASGRFVEAVQSASNARVTRIRYNVTRAIQRVAKQVAFLLIENEDEDRFYTISRDWTNPKYAQFNLGVLEFEEYDFEAKWDVKVNAADVLPVNPVDQNVMIMTQLEQLMQYPPETQQALLNMLNIPEKGQLRYALGVHQKAMAAAAEQQGPDPELMKVQAETEKVVTDARVKMQQSIAENVGDGLEKEANTVSTMSPGSATEAIMNIPLKIKDAMANAGMIELFPDLQTRVGEGESTPEQQRLEAEAGPL